MDHQFIHPDGPQDQANIQHCSCDCAHYLASQGIWAVHLSDERNRIVS